MSAPPRPRAGLRQPPQRTLQRAVGFEFELQVPLVREQDGGYVDSGLTKSKPVFTHTESEPFDLVEDHAAGVRGAGWDAQSILEIATRHRDEFLSEKEFLLPVERAVALAAGIQSGTQNLSTVVPLTTIFPAAQPADLLVGRPKTSGVYWDGVSTSANVQATYGLRLSAVGPWAERMSKMRRVLPHEPELLGQAIEAAPAVCGKLTVADLAFEGLVYLFCLYLVGGRLALSALDKNRVPLLVRDALTTVMVPELLQGETIARLKEPEFRAKLAQALMDATRRAPTEPLFIEAKENPLTAAPETEKKSTGPTVADWLEGVLSGKEDKQASQWGQSKAIPAERVGPGKELAPVVEERAVPPPGVQYGGLHAPDRWLALALDYRQKLRAASGAAEEKKPAPPAVAPPPPVTAPDLSLPAKQAAAPSVGGTLPPGTLLDVHGLRLKIVGLTPEGRSYLTETAKGDTGPKIPIQLPGKVKVLSGVT